MRRPVNVAAVIVLCCLVSMTANLFAVSLTVNPPLVTNDYAGQVAVGISGLTSEKTVLVERFVDANGNGLVDANEDVLTFTFRVTDGQVPLIGGVRNPSVPGDDDGTTNGSIRADLPFPSADESYGLAAAKFIFRVSDPHNVFSPVTASFEVQQHVQPQGVSGRITALASGAPLPRALVALLPSSQQFTIAVVLADANGNYSFYAAPGTYSVAALYNGFACDQTAGAVTVVANQFATRDLALVDTEYTISGEVSDNSSGEGIGGVFVLAGSASNSLFAGGLSDASGHYSFSVAAGQWSVGTSVRTLAQLGYVDRQDRVNITVGGAITINFPLPKATALVYGTVKDTFGNPVTAVFTEAYGWDNPYRGSGFTFSPNANYATGVLAGTWSIAPDPDILAAKGYAGTPSQVTLSAGQALQVNFIVTPLTGATPTPTPVPTPTPTPGGPTPTPGGPTPTPTPAASTVLANISTRLRVETGDNVLIGGFIVTGTQPKKVIVRAIGPSLPFAGTLADPILELRGSSGVLISSNDNWRSDDEAEIIATGVPPGNDLESAIVATLPANTYTAIVRGVNNGTGIGVVEAYDLDRTVDSKLANISTRGFVQTGDNVLIGGLIVVGQNSLRVIVRAIGPSLPVPGLGDPTLELHDGNGALIDSNDNWRSDHEAEIIATTIPPTNDLESAIVRNLTPGNYTAIVRGVNNTTGVALVEAYGLN